MIGGDLVYEFLSCRRAQRIGQQVHVQRQHIAGLRIAALALRIWIIDLSEGRRAVICTRDEPIRMHKLLFESRTNLFEELFIFLFGLSTPPRMWQLSHDP